MYLATVGAVGGFVAYTYALRATCRCRSVSLYTYINPIIAVALGVLLVGEPFNVRIAIAAALVLVGVAVVRSKREKRDRLLDRLFEFRSGVAAEAERERHRPVDDDGPATRAKPRADPSGCGGA